MPHLVVLYTRHLDAELDIGALCRALADSMCVCRDEAGQPVFPVGGVRVLAYPSTHHAVADGSADFGFIYLNLRMGRGRGEAARRRAGEALAAVVRDHLGPLVARRLLGVTLQIDEGAEVFDAKFGNLHDHFARKP